MGTFKLEIEPIPESTWGVSLANLLPGEVWGTLRREVYSCFDYSCSVCGAKDKQLQCHERWSYDDSKLIQKLVGFQCLCIDCHSIKHWGRTVVEARKAGDVSKLDILIDHFCKVNNCSKEDFMKHKAEVESIVKKRSKKKYKVDFGAFEPRRVVDIWLKRGVDRR